MAARLNTFDAVSIGVASMLGAGVFVVFGPVAAITGAYLPIAILLAGFVAFLNAGSISQLAAKIPRSGGAYSYARQYLSPSWGFLAGISFLLGKIGSAAAIALVFASYLAPDNQVLVAVLAVISMTLINIAGITRTALGSKILGGITLFFLTVVILASLFTPNTEAVLEPGNLLNVPAGAAVIFFAFAGYARIATIGGELENPRTQVPRAIAISFVIVGATYLALGLILPAKLGAGLGGSMVPVADLVSVALPGVGPQSLAIFVSIAALGSLLALLPGMSRTAAVMAEDGEIPRVFRLQLKNNVPIFAEVSVAVLALALILSESVIFAISISSFAVLTYYAIANLAAFRQPKEQTSRPKWLNLLGAAACLLLCLSVPWQGLLLGVVVLTVAMFLRWGLASLS